MFPVVKALNTLKIARQSVIRKQSHERYNLSITGARNVENFSSLGLCMALKNALLYLSNHKAFYCADHLWFSKITKGA